MKSRMDKYYTSDNINERTKKNDSLYDELYHEKQNIENNVTVIDNVNEINLDEIREMINRENYKKIRDYNLIQRKQEIEENKTFYDTDYSLYDINEIMEKKKLEKDISNKVRKISDEDYEILESLTITTKIEDVNNEMPKGSFLNTTDVNNDDLFSNLKDEDEKNETAKEISDDTKEEDFYTKTSKIKKNDFSDEDDDEEKSGNSTLFIIIAIVGVLLAVLSIVYIKFLQ